MFVSNGSSPVLQFAIILALMVSQSGCSIIISSSEQDQSIMTRTSVITSDTDLANLATDGTGTLGDPYILRLNIFERKGIFEQDRVRLEISNTRAYFILKDSLIWSYFYPDQVLALRNVSHGSIEHSEIRGFEHLSGEGILVENCSCVKILKTHVSDCGEGIRIAESDDCLIANCTVYENLVGIRMIHAENTTVTWNTIVHNNDGIVASGVHNRIYGNRIGWNSPNAYDHGSASWDNGIDLGNYWSDYDGAGVYNITGPEHAQDNYPARLQDGDYSAPVIEYNEGYGESTGNFFALPKDQIKITANVSDESGTDTVLIISTVNDTMYFYEMTPDPDIGENGYSYVFGGPFTDFSLRYFIWANDTNGYAAHTENDRIEFHAYVDIVSITTIILLIVLITSIGVGVCIFLRRR